MPDGSKVYSAGTYYIQRGQIVSAYTKTARSSGGGTYGVTVGGTLVAVAGTTAKCAFTNNVTITMSGSSTWGYLVAIANTCLITFEGCGGTPSFSSAYTTGSGTLSSLPTATKEGKALLGWYTAEEGGTQITTSTVFSADTTVYARWADL